MKPEQSPPSQLLRTISADLGTGSLEGDAPASETASGAEVFHEFAAIASELLGSHEMPWDVVFSRVGEGSGGLDSIVLIASEHLYIAHRSGEDPERCHLGIASRRQSIGFAVAQTRAKESKG